MSTGQISVRARPGMTIAAATIMGLPLGSIYAFSVFLTPLEQLLRVSRSELATVFGLSIVFFTIGANLVPRLFGYVRAPLLVFLTSALSAAGVILVAVAPSAAPERARSTDESRTSGCTPWSNRIRSAWLVGSGGRPCGSVHKPRESTPISPRVPTQFS